MLNLPTLIKAYLIDPEPEVKVSGSYPSLLNPAAELQALHFANWSVVLEDDHWAYQFKDTVLSSNYQCTRVVTEMAGTCRHRS